MRAGRATAIRRWALGVMIGAALVLPSGVGSAEHEVPEASGKLQSQTHRAYGDWFSSRFGGGGYLLDAWSSQVRDRWYVWSDVGGLYRSDDGAQTWHALHPNLPRGEGDVNCVRGFLEHAEDPGRLVLMTGTRWRDVGGIWTSDDGGQSWTKRLTALFWANAEGRQSGSTLIVHPGSPETLIAAGQDGVFRSTDFGQTWTKTHAPEGLNPVLLWIDPQDPASCWLSAVPLQTYTQGQAIETRGGWFRSGDHGQSWVRQADAGPTEIVVDPESSHWIGLIDHLPYVSHDRGLTWAQSDQGLPASDQNRASEISPRRSRALHLLAGRVVLANGQGDLFRFDHSPDGTAPVWRPIEREAIDAPAWWYGNTGQREGWVHFGKSAASITVDRHNPDRWLMTDWYAAWISDDAGRRWRFAADGIENTVLHGVKMHPEKPATVFAFAADHGILRSDDGGLSFVDVAMPGHPLRSNVKQLVIAPSNPQIMWAIGNTAPGQWESSAIANSRDGGLTWRYPAKRGLPDGLGQAHFINSIAVDPHDPAVAWVAVSGPVGDRAGGVYRTENAGEDWVSLNHGLPSGQSMFAANIWDSGPELVASPGGQLLAIGQADHNVYHWSSRTNKWRVNSALPAAPSALAVDPNDTDRYWVASQEGGLWVGDLRGTPPRRVFDTGVNAVALDPSGPSIVVSTSDGVWLSPDRGQTWSNLSPGLLDRFQPHVAISSGHLVVGTKGNGIMSYRPTGRPR